MSAAERELESSLRHTLYHMFRFLIPVYICLYTIFQSYCLYVCDFYSWQSMSSNRFNLIAAKSPCLYATHFLLLRLVSTSTSTIQIHSNNRIGCMVNGHTTNFFLSMLAFFFGSKKCHEYVDKIDLSTSSSICSWIFGLKITKMYMNCTELRSIIIEIDGKSKYTWL